jgi:integrase
VGRDGLGLWFRGGECWYLATNVQGRRIRRSLHTRDRKVALTRAHQLIADLERRGPIALQMNRATVAQALALAASDARVNGRKSAWKTGKNVERLSAALGDLKLAALTGAHIMVYVDQRKAAGFANASINRELATLRRGLILAADAGLVSRDAIPRIRLLKEAPARRGFFDRDQFETVRRNLPAALKPVVTVAYITGWRLRSEILPMQWRQVDLAAETIRLDPGTTKNDEGRLFVMTPDLKATLAAQWAGTDALQRETGQIIPFIFHRTGTPIKSFRRAWLLACERAGVPGRIPHDFRRTAVRNLERAGIARSVAMKVVGHRTESIYRRYAIVSEGDLRDAARKLAAIDRDTSNGSGLGSHPGHEPEGVQNKPAQHQVAGGPRRRSTDAETKQ